MKEMESDTTTIGDGVKKLDVNDSQPAKDEGPSPIEEEEEDPDWWKELKKHPFFATKDPEPHEVEASPEWQALQALAYDDEEPWDLANTYKKDGNRYFKVKHYRTAIEHYSEGIKAKCGDPELNCILYCNKATCNWYLKNYRSCLKDCLFSRKFKRDHLKAIIKGAQSLHALKRPKEAMEWCDEGLAIDPKNDILLEVRAKSEQLKKTIERDRRKKKVEAMRINKEENDLVNALKDRGIKFEEFEKISQGELHHLECRHPAGGRVFLDEEGVLYWPVMFIYPEFSDTDFIQAYNENSCFIDHMSNMFGPQSCPPPWDLNRQYTPETIQIFFEDRLEKKIHTVDQSSTLKLLLQNKHYTVAAGTPSFFILRKGSKFAEDYLGKYL